MCIETIVHNLSCVTQLVRANLHIRRVQKLLVGIVLPALVPLSANSQMTLPAVTVGDDSEFAFAKLHHIENHMYHTGIDLGNANDEDRTLVRAAQSGRVVSVVGLAPGGAEDAYNDRCDDGNAQTEDGNEQIRLWYDGNPRGSLDPNELSSASDLTSVDLITRLATCTGRNRSNHGLGIAVVIEHSRGSLSSPGVYTLYAHLSAIRADIWDRVAGLGQTFRIESGEPIGVIGRSYIRDLRPTNFNAHLHFEVKTTNTFGSPRTDTRDYWGYTPDIPTAYGFRDPKLSFYPPPPATSSQVAVRVIENERPASSSDNERGVRIRTGPGTWYSTLGWTGLRQTFVSDQQALSIPSGDTVNGRRWYRIHLPSRVRNATGSEPATGWIAATGDQEGVAQVEEVNTATIVEVVGDNNQGWRLRKDPDQDCGPSIVPPPCVSVWDNVLSRYETVRAWNDTRFVRRRSRVASDGWTWHEIDIPKFYFHNPAATESCASPPSDDQCVGQITQAWLRDDAIRFVEEPNASEVDVVLIIDSSGSMIWNDPLNRRKNAARVYVTASGVGDHVGVVDFDGSARIASSLLPLPGSRDLLFAAVNSIDSVGGTNIGAGLRAGCDVLAASVSSNSRRAAIMLTDGDGAYGGEDACFAANGWPVFTFGIGDANRALLQSIAANTGGEFSDLPTSELVCRFQVVRARIAGVPPGPCTSLWVTPFSTMSLFATVATSQAQATFSTSWGGSDVVMTLIAPSGRTIDRYTTGAGVFHDRGDAFEVLTVLNPEAGIWEIRLFGADVPEQGEEVVFGLTTIPSPVLDVKIDLKPGDGNNVVNIGSKGVLPVVVLTSGSFDATEVDPNSLLLAGGVSRIKGRSGKIGVLTDIDLDGDVDLLVHFETTSVALSTADTKVVLTGRTLAGHKIRGEDNIRVLSKGK